MNSGPANLQPFYPIIQIELWKLCSGKPSRFSPFCYAAHLFRIIAQYPITNNVVCACTRERIAIWIENQILVIRFRCVFLFGSIFSGRR